LHSAERWVNQTHFTRVATVKGLRRSYLPFTILGAMPPQLRGGGKQEVLRAQ
jgi:hypothetical protein